MSKYGPFCRRLISDDGDTTYLCILNPGNLDMFFMCESNEPNHKMVNSNYFLTAPTDNSNPFQPIVAFHIETSHLICIANQMTGFYMKYNTGLT